MRTTLRIDDDLMRELKAQSRNESIPLTRLINHLIRRGLEAARGSRAKPRKPFREQTLSMGAPRQDLTKALALAASLEDEVVVEKLARRK